MFRGSNGTAGVELVTGLMTPSQLAYRVGSTWDTSPFPAKYDSISEIRVTVAAHGDADGDSTSTDGYSTSMTFRVPLKGGAQ